ncbi:MAG: sigma-54-dependent Fis family transcriptional regulator [Verrucomicrobia bacterium]|nr:sigma-54-dependent Fis family transcriptional regulator [Verrucomicrobiota bacterium]
MPASAQPAPGSAGLVLIVDDDPGQRSLLNSFLQGQGFQTLTADSGEAALSILKLHPIQLMISDVRMPGLSGLETLRSARRQNLNVPVLLVTAYADIRDAVTAMRDGAVNYLSKPIDLDELLSSVRKAIGVPTGDGLRLNGGLRLPSWVVGASPLMESAFRDAALIAGSDSRVLITGESGVGKEVLADLIHYWSPRQSKPMVKVNCAAIPANLLESELFGHEKGSFTGASQQRIGRFEAANGGTLFLDEIAELAPALQGKLLRVTQDGCFQRVGSNVDIRSDARLITATNKNLEEEVQKGLFREDLFYRLTVFELNLPALRERPEDILPLAHHFIRQLTQGRARLSPTAAESLLAYAWPGTVRELRNAMERAALLSGGELILPDHLPTKPRQASAATARVVAGASAKLEEVENQAILLALAQHHYNRTEAAKALGISRRNLLYKLHRLRGLGHVVDPPDPSGSASASASPPGS